MTLKERNELIVKIAQDNPEIPQKELATRFGVTRQRISMIFKEYGYKKPKKIYRCHICKVQVDNNRNRCRPCYLESKKYTIVCAFCDNKYTYYGRAATVKRTYDRKRKTENRFCSAKCAGAYLGTNFGKGSK